MRLSSCQGGRTPHYHFNENLMGVRKTMIRMIQSLKKGDRVEFTCELDREPNATVTRGERGTVSRIDADGHVDIRLDAYHAGLTDYANCMWLEPGYTDDVHLKRVRSYDCVGKIALLLAATLALFVVVELGEDAYLGTPPFAAHAYHAPICTPPLDVNLYLPIASHTGDASL